MDRHKGRRIAVTGGAGFIGANFLLHAVPASPENLFVNIDALTYAASLSRLQGIASAQNYRFEHLDIRDQEAVLACLKQHDITDVIHFAAESHVDRSLYSPGIFVETNVIGTLNLLHSALTVAQEAGRTPADCRFLHVSTDEVYGSLELDTQDLFTELTPYDPSSPYAASKAASDHLVRAWGRTYGLDVVITNCSNNYGAYQFPEKLIPLMIANALTGQELPVYGDGKNVRDWVMVADHCQALDLVFQRGVSGETYNIGGNSEVANIDVVNAICDLVDGAADPLPSGQSRRSLIRFVTDRPGHDRRYAIDASKILAQLGWAPSHTFTSGLQATVDWYLANQAWVADCRGGDEYQEHYQKHYGATRDKKS